MSPGQAMGEIVHHVKQRWEDNPIVTFIKALFYIGMLVSTLTTTWALKSAGHMIINFPFVEKRVEDLEKIKAGPRLDQTEKDVKELQDLHPRRSLR